MAWAQAVGAEVTRHGVQVNALAFNFVDTPTYFPPEVKANPRFQERLKREVPLGRSARARRPSSLPSCAARPRTVRRLGVAGQRRLGAR
ncbi:MULTISPECIES: hypothetical protein [Burkholderiales]|uniref:hypothetical protein n=1 Tax=Variovorax paradoxus TaxID=34073 RepID=UPI000A4380D1|nr:hypothetical protein [Xenophilus azovorans]